MLAERASFENLRQKARESVLERYELKDCLARQKAKVLALAG
jgi:hypothetical protein